MPMSSSATSGFNSPNTESATGPSCTLVTSCPSMRRSEPDSQAAFGTICRRVDLREHVENPRQGRGADTNAAVGDANHHIARLTACGQTDLPLWIGVFGRVCQEIRKHLRNP